MEVKIRYRHNIDYADIDLDYCMEELYICGMKQILWPAALIWVLVSCTQPRTRSENFNWPPIDSAFDSIAYLIDEKMIRMNPDRETEMSELRRAYHNSPKIDELKGRKLYWDGEYLSRVRHEPDSAMSLFKQALAVTDSARYPYDYARIKMSLSFDTDLDLYYRYRIMRENEKVFAEAGDPVMVGLCQVEVGNILESIGDSRRAMENFKHAIESFTLAGLDFVNPRIKMNLSRSFNNIGHQEEARLIMEQVMEDSHIMGNMALRHLALMNYYYLTGDTYSLMQSYEISSNRDFLFEMKVCEGVEIGKRLILEGKRDSAAMYIQDAYKYIDSLSDLQERVNLLDAKIRLDAASGQYAAIPELYSRMRIYQDSLEVMHTDADILAEETRYMITRSQVMHEKAIGKHRLVTWIVVLIAVIITLVVLFVGSVIRTRLIREKLNMERRLAHTRESLAAYRLHQQLTSDMLDGFVEAAETACRQPGQADNSLKWLKNQVSIHRAQSKEWESVVETVQQIHPDFEAKISKAYPSLSKKQIEFAGYIVLGMTTKQIAEILKIDIASANTNRYRLRRKMGLQNGESLEEAINKMLD